MHEFSICERIVEAVLGELSALRPAPKRLCKARVVVGRLHQIVPDYLTFAYELLTRDTAAEGSEMELIQAPVVGKCRSCGWCGDIELPIFRCGDCGALDVELVSGKELRLEQLEVELWEGSHSAEPPMAPAKETRVR
jgi:hydrogenase nickel incorporation protein HypA/HybF